MYEFSIFGVVYMDSVFTNLISQDESVWLEFKSYWYWSNDPKSKESGWNEFLKDCSAMFNSRISKSDNNEKKYIVFGFDEKTYKNNNYYQDGTGNEVDGLKNTDELKLELIKKLNKRFDCYPNFRESNSLYSLEEFIEFDTVIYEDKINLVLTIHNAPYLLMLKSNAGKGSRIGDIYIRTLKTDRSPENTLADHSKVSQLVSRINEVEYEDYPQIETTILNVVDAFRDKHLPDADIISQKNERNYTTGICYELYTIDSEYSNSINFLYFTKHTLQNKTFEHLKNLKVIGKSEKLFVLIDRFNKKGGILDKNRIGHMFQEYYSSSEVYYIEDFSLVKLYEELFNNDVFYKGQPLNKNFIKPYTQESEVKTADFLINEWYKEKNYPLLVLKGSGGCGKTTVVKQFIKNIYKLSEDINVLYINSHEIINDIMRMGKIEDIFDFYSILADKNNLRKKFNKKLLALSSDNGNLIIVLDGIDEVIAKKGIDFNLNALIESIFSDYYGNLNKTKVIMTCRDFFWDDSQNIGDVKTFNLKPFDKSLATQYFSKVFNSDEKKIRQSMKIASDFIITNDKNEPDLYIPYILDMIKENIVFDNSLDFELKTDILQYESNVHDYLIAKSCEREIIKLDNLKIDEQLKIFSRIAIDYDGILNEKHLESILNSMHATKNLNKFKDHPLLVYDNKQLSFRYDFFSIYFKCLTLYNFLSNDNFFEIDKDMVSILVNQIGYGNEFTSMLKSRFNKDFIEKLKEILLFLINDEYDIRHLKDNYSISRLSSSLFILLLDICNNYTKNDRTNLVKDIYEKDGYIDQLSIINLHSEYTKIVFDFRGLSFNNCFFENYDTFSECSFDENTVFKNTIFKPTLSRKNITTNISNNNIDFSTCNTIGLHELLENKIALRDIKKDETRRNVKRIISYFWNNGYFTDKLEREAKSRFKNINQTFEKLIQIGVVLTKKHSTPQKRMDTLYYLSEDYLDLRKIFEENTTCYEFESILKKIDKLQE